MKTKEHRIEDIRRSCLNCGHEHYNHDPCCSDVFCVSDLQRENKKLQATISEMSEVVLFYDKALCQDGGKMAENFIFKHPDIFKQLLPAVE